MTVQSYDYRLRKFTEWWEDEIEELSRKDVHEYKTHLQDQGLAKPTVKAHIDTFRGFIDYMARLGYADEGLVEVADSPSLSGKENVRDDEVKTDVVHQILTKLDRYDYASMHHVLILLLWRTGLRMWSVRTLYLNDYHADEDYLDIEHRPESETPLKNKEAGERKVALSEETCAVLSDYISEKRVVVEDKHRREPLLTTGHGRVSRNTIRKWCYRVTRPCWHSGEHSFA
jgi:site-specific recombinase XerD